MAVAPDLLEILACPVCLAPVKLTADSQGLCCSKCHRVYPIRQDIPIMLVDEARIETSGDSAIDAKGAIQSTPSARNETPRPE